MIKYNNNNNNTDHNNYNITYDYDLKHFHHTLYVLTNMCIGVILLYDFCTPFIWFVKG